MWMAWLLGCVPSTGPDTGPVGIDLPPPACLDHAYLPLDSMGEILESRRDEFISYDPEGLEDILGVLGEEYDGLAPFEYALDAYQVRYRTQDRGVEAEASTLVIVPRGVTGDLPVIVWMHPTAGANDICAPSGLGVFFSGLPLAFAARLGVVVIAPDLLGLLNGGESANTHPYIVPEPAALSSWDAVRAAENLANENGVSLNTSELVLWGPSQGAHAALWTDRYARGYAPEYGVSGVVATVPPSNLEGLFLFGASEESPASQALPGVMYAMAEWYGLDLGELIPESVHATIEASMTETCDVLDAAGDVDALEDLFTAELRAGELSDAWACATGANQIANTPLPSSGAPVYWVLGEEDRLAYAPLAREDAEALCAQNVPLEFLECAGLGHEDAALQTVFLQEAWVAARLEGRPLQAPCVIGPAEVCPEG